MKAVPPSIATAANRRMADAAETQSAVVEAIRRGRPLDAEDDPERKLAYIQRAVGVDRSIAERIARYDDPGRLPLTPSQKSAAESLQGNTADFVPVYYLEVARAACRSVARVAYADRTPEGTGFLVSPRLFLTNQHVIPDTRAARAFFLEFGYEEDVNLTIRPVTRFALDPEQLFLSDPSDDLDFCLVAVGRRIDGDASLGDFGCLPLFDTPDRHMKAMFVNVIQHPSGRPKQLVVRENRILARTENTLIYGTDTLPGSSGSPVLNDKWEVIALHHWGSPERARLDPAVELPAEGNEGIRISSIVGHLKNALGGLPAAQAALLREVLNPASGRPIPLSLSQPEGRTTHMTPTELQPLGTGPQVTADGTATWTIPLVISVRLGAGLAAEIDSTKVVTGREGELEEKKTPPPGAEAFRPDQQYENRLGYNPDFLGIPVDPPRLSAAQQALAARNLTAREGEDPFEVKYQHFSVVMNGARRLAFFTASNVDGASVVKINRETGLVTSVEVPEDEGAEAYEKWWDDPRIDASQRSNQKLYNSPELDDFQRGHLVKRTDPSWGSAERALRGQADTFHFTNCAPQHRLFNPIKTRWAGVEDWITEGSDKRDLRVTVFSGPVLRDDDLPLSYIQVPREFWKVVVRVEDGELLATAILADQGDLLPPPGGAPPGPEDLPPLPANLPAEYQVTVRHLEELTGLDFGPLRDHDTFAGGPESAAPKRRIQAYADLQIRRPPKRRRKS